MLSYNTTDLKDVSTHFKFGENWANFSKKIDEGRIKRAELSLINLIGETSLKGKRFIDIGCGSGLFSLAAARLGASEIVSIDIDPECTKITQELLDALSPHDNHKVINRSIFKIEDHPEATGKFDVVFSWGVLHHTGDMFDAIRIAATLLKDKNSKLALALYYKTLCCPLWKKIKRFYMNRSTISQKLMCLVYLSVYLLGKTVTFNNPLSVYKNYSKDRGMSLLHDIHDWMGGYPYESISNEEIMELAESLKLNLEFKKISRRRLGLLGSGCNEFLLTPQSE